MLKSSKGITLVALVITIILLLILAGVTLKIVLDQGFVDKAQNAVDRYDHASTNETEQVQNFFERMENLVDKIDAKQSASPSNP